MAETVDIKSYETRGALRYSVPEQWGDGLYRDSAPCRSAARPFTLLHGEKPEECWLLLHGYRGYPGEMVRPAVDLFDAGFDVYVPRLPGHGTSRRDFIRSHGRDWMGLAEQACADLKGRYKTVHLLAHSMGTAMAASLGCGDPQIGKLVYVCPSFENAQMPLPARVLLAVLSPFTPTLKCGWHANPNYRMHYENAPCDDQYLGREYWQYYFTRQLLDYYRIMKQGLRAVREHPHEDLVLYPLKDRFISAPSVELYRRAKGDRANVVEIKNGTHPLLYDKDPQAEEAAIRAILDFAGHPETGNETKA